MVKRPISWLIALILLSGCGILSKQEPIKYIAYTYEQPYDLVYLKTMEVLDSDNNWVFGVTRKELGTIEMRNINYANWFGMDRQYVKFLVKYVSPTETSVEIDPANTSCKGKTCIDLLERVNKALGALPPHPKKEVPPQEEATETIQPKPAE